MIIDNAAHRTWLKVAKSENQPNSRNEFDLLERIKGDTAVSLSWQRGLDMDGREK